LGSLLLPLPLRIETEITNHNQTAWMFYVRSNTVLAVLVKNNQLSRLNSEKQCKLKRKQEGFVGIELENETTLSQNI
jgi:hypothetical protein